MLDITLRELWWRFLDLIRWPQKEPERSPEMDAAQDALLKWEQETLRRDILREFGETQ